MNKIIPWVVTGGAVLVLLVAAGGHMLSGSQTSAPVSMTRVASSTTSDSQSQPTATSADKFADWKTYNSDKYNFSFRYPSSWQLLLGADAYDGPSGNIFADSAAAIMPISPTSTYRESFFV